MKKILVLTLLLTFKAGAQTSALEIADSLFQLGNFSKAISYYEKDNTEAIYNQTKIAQAYIGIGAIRKAIPYYENIVSKDSLLLIAQYELGKLYTKTKGYKKAAYQFKLLIRKDSLNPNFYYQLGLVQKQSKNGNYVQSFIKAYQLDKLHLKSIKQLCKNFLKRENWKLFDYYITEGLKEYPENQELINYKAQACFNRQLYKTAITYFSKLYSTNPKNKFVIYKLGVSHHALQEYQKAIEYYKEAIEIDSTNGDYHTQVGKAYLAIEEFQSSFIHLYLAKKYNDTSIDREFYNIGMLHKAKKEYSRAIKLFQNALKENNYNHHAQFELAICADNYYKDTASKLKLYEIYKLSFEGKNKRYDEIVDTRISHYKTELHIED